MTERHSTQVLRECIEVAEKKNHDYQNALSAVKQADYYPNGIDTIYDIMHAKMLRIKSLLAVVKSGGEPKNEALEDSFKDLVNYSSFGVSYLRYRMDGQDPDRDVFNRRVVEEAKTIKIGNTTPSRLVGGKIEFADPRTGLFDGEQP